MTPEQQAVVEALVAGQGRARATVSTNVVQFIARLLAGMSGRWYDNRAVTDFKVQVIEAVRNGQEVIADATAGYLDQVVAEMGGTPPRGSVQLPERLRAVDPIEQWERPAKEYRRARLLGADDLEAELAAERRAEQMAEMDLGLAMREAARQRIAPVDNARGFRRVIHPELSSSGTCGLCVVASDRVYGRRELLPLHNGCRCEVLPILSAGDPGLRINKADLQAIYDAAGSTGRQKLQRTRVTVNEHGELGPVLSADGQNFRDDKDVKHDVGKGMTPAERAAGELRVLERTLAELERRAAAGEDVAGPLAYQRDRVKALRAAAKAAA